MPVFNSVKDLSILISIVGLLGVGAGISLKSGLVASGRERGSQLVGNLSRMLVTLAGYAALFSMAQRLVGYKLSFLP